MATTLRAPKSTQTDTAAELARLRAALEAADREKAELLTENRGLREEVQACVAARDDARQREEGAADVLRVISGGLSDPRAAFRALGERAMRLCRASAGVVALFDGERYWPTAGVGAGYDGNKGWGARLTPPDWAVSLNARGINVPAARAISTGQTQHAPDLLEDPDFRERLEDPEWRERMGTGLEHGRAVLSAPLKGARGVLGAVSVMRLEPGPFAPDEIARLETFAAQVVIAIENFRLLAELQRDS
jgi:two-component system, NtrC family, sensor kinase